MAATKPSLVTTPFASTGDVTTIPITDANGFVNFSAGYTADYELSLSAGNASAKAVERGVQNSLFNLATTAIQYWQTNSRPCWYDDFPGGYGIYAEVIGSNGKPYRSLVSTNTSDPTLNSTNWEYIQGSTEMVANIPMPSGGPSGSSARDISATTGIDFNNYVSNGTYQFLSDAAVTGAANAPANGGTKAGAGVLEVTGWTVGTATYVTQMFRDRNGIGMLRGALSGSWTAWKIWVNSTQYVPGEIRMYTGTATNAAVQAAYGAGWYVCDGTNGTPNLSDRFIVGQSATKAAGASGGNSSVTLATANIPAHTHAITITDNGHVHAITDNGHAHSIYDPGHAHSVYDPGHQHHLSNMVNATAGNAYPYAMTPGGGQGYYTDAAATGIGIYGNGTGISIYANVTGITVNTAKTGITATAASVGNGTAFDITNPYYAVVFIMYTGK